MARKHSVAVAAALVTMLVATLVSGSVEAACDPGKTADEMSHEDASKVYDCIAGDLHKAYMKDDKGWIPAETVANYRNWTRAAKFPAAPGFHGNRFLITWVNQVGAAEYLQYKDEAVNIPAGTIIAKESFAITKDGKVRKGPLFFMEKTAAGKSPKSNDWYYYAVAPNGKPMAIDVYKACSECHMENFGHQGGLGYPVEEARIGN